MNQKRQEALARGEAMFGSVRKVENSDSGYMRQQLARQFKKEIAKRDFSDAKLQKGIQQLAKETGLGEFEIKQDLAKDVEGMED